ncbi:MAG: hypothetical protein ABI763_17360 [Bacteroidota bacterium]
MKQIVYCLIALLLAFSLPCVVNAQSGYEDVVYLKNGSIIHGTIIEQIPNESIKIQTKDKNIFVYKIDEVLKMTKEETTRSVDSGRHSRDAATKDNMKKNGYTNITELSFGRSFKNTTTTYYDGFNSYVNDTHADEVNNNPSIGVQTINGYKFSPYVSAGIGVGFNIYSQVLLVPVFVGVRANLLDKRVTPFLAFDVGYSYSRKQITGGTLARDDKGGIMLSPALGVKFNMTNKMALNLSLGFRYQEIQIIDDYSNYSYPYNNYTGQYYKTFDIRMFNLKFGFTF